jgi:hypothetical protein
VVGDESVVVVSGSVVSDVPLLSSAVALLLEEVDPSAPVAVVSSSVVPSSVPVSSPEVGVAVVSLADPPLADAVLADIDPADDGVGSVGAGLVALPPVDPVPASPSWRHSSDGSSTTHPLFEATHTLQNSPCAQAAAPPWLPQCVSLSIVHAKPSTPTSNDTDPKRSMLATTASRMPSKGRLVARS